MRPLLLLAGITTLFCATAQKESANWCIDPNSLIHFNTLPPVISYGNAFTSAESSASISDENGNLIFYTDGETVRGADGNILPNGANVSYSPTIVQQSTTQGALFLKKPGSVNLYYLFSLGFLNLTAQRARLSYCVLDRNLNGGLGDVVSQVHVLSVDTLAENMTATRHCNGKDYWVVIVKCITLKATDGQPVEYDTEFRSFLVTENGVEPSPVKTRLHTNCTRYGQMKFNNAGDELAFGENNSLTLLSFDKATGKVAIKAEYTLPLGNAYGIEYSPNDLFVYVNQKQVELSTGLLTNLYSNYPSQLQRGLDGKIYSIRLTPNEGIFYYSVPFKWRSPNHWFLFGTKDSTLNMAAVEQPDLPGTSCLFNPNYVTFTHPDYYNTASVALPNFPSFIFNQKVSDFTYSGTCPGDNYQFLLADPSVVPDSVQWIFHDDGTTSNTLSPQHQYTEAGEWEVTAIVYVGGVPSITTYCVIVCGPSSIVLPERIDLCKTPAPFELNPLSTCAYNYTWSTGDTTSAITIANAGTYTLQATGDCGTNTYTVEVVEGDDCTVLTEIPNVITANGDEINDLFSIKVKNARSFDYTILNRWGNVVAEGTKTVPPTAVFDWSTFSLWDGKTTSGLAASDGVYFYVIDFTLFNGKSFSKSGFLQVFN